MANETADHAATVGFDLPSPGEVEELLRETATALRPWPGVDDRAAWEKLAATPHGAAMMRAVLAAAEEEAKTPGVRQPSLTEFLAYRRTGDRRTWEDVADRIRARMETFAMALCFTGEPVWADRTADALWSLCEMTGWVTPAHEQMPIPDPQNPTVDLWSAMTAQEVAEALQLIAPALDHIDPHLARHVRREVERRVLDPFLARGDWWWLFPQPERSRLNNWTAVCSGGVLCAALALPGIDPDKQARIVHKAAWSLAFFRDTFEAEGSLDEGVGYWSYGFSYYVMAAERLAAHTGGRMDLLADPFWKKVAAFPLGVRLYGDTFVNFSDCAPRVRPVPGWVAWLGEKVGEPGLTAWAARLAAEESAGFGAHHRYLPFSLRTLTWTPAPGPEAPSFAADFPPTTYLPDVQWLVARSDASDEALILAIKGGHNAENHNHNDGGSFLVHYRQEPLIAELGAPTYTRQFFSGERYENIAARSLGHSVPYVNGCEQRAGREYAAKVTAREGASLTLELAGLYPPEAGLASLTRSVELKAGDAGAATITLSDEARFTGDGGAMLALPLITLDAAPAVTGPGSARIAGERGALLDIAWDPGQATCRVEAVPTDDPKFQDAEGNTRVRRLWFDVTVAGRAARLDLTMTPGINSPQ